MNIVDLNIAGDRDRPDRQKCQSVLAFDAALSLRFPKR
jgi:hypothetical protein